MSLRFNVIYCGYYFKLIPTHMAFMYYHAFTNICVAICWMINGAVILHYISSVYKQGANAIHLITVINCTVTTLICAVDAIWYIAAIKDHVEKEHMTSVVFLGVNLVFTAAFLMIISAYKNSFDNNESEKETPLATN